MGTVIDFAQRYIWLIPEDGNLDRGLSGFGMTRPPGFELTAGQYTECIALPVNCLPATSSATGGSPRLLDRCPKCATIQLLRGTEQEGERGRAGVIIATCELLRLWRKVKDDLLRDLLLFPRPALSASILPFEGHL